MEQRLSIITLGVSDLTKAKAFYDGLGWQAASSLDTEEIIAYDLQSMALALYPWDKLAKDAGVSTERSGPSAITLAYNVGSEQDVDHMLKAATELGATVTKPAQKAFWGGYSGCFSDPDGHIWEIAFNPFSKLGPNGEFQWNGVT
tara:strand:- start:2891 stop:3325 length:435 start_codon:yes stop_codon:yes gene_type:complete